MWKVGTGGGYHDSRRRARGRGTDKGRTGGNVAVLTGIQDGMRKANISRYLARGERPAFET